MRRLMLLLLILLSMAFLANSLKPISLSGNGGMALLMGLTNNSENMNATNNTTLNLSNGRSLIPLSGNNGTKLLDNLSKTPANLSFGSTPRNPPPAPPYDPKSIELYNILRQNHVGD